MVEEKHESEEKRAVDEGNHPSRADENGRDRQAPPRADEEDRREDIEILEPPEIGLAPPNSRHSPRRGHSPRHRREFVLVSPPPVWFNRA